jgi:hypothetical protein
MRWLSGWMRKKLEPAWEFKSKGLLWRLVPSSSGFFVGEDRDVDAKTTSFFCLDQKSGVVLWRDVQFNEHWWIGIEEIHKDILFLHEYATPDLPEHKKIYAVSLATGTTMWSNDAVKFLFAYGEYLYTSKDSYDERIFFEVGIHTGTVARELDAEYVRGLADIAAAKKIEQIEFPFPFDAEKMTDSQIKKGIEQATSGARNVRQIEYLSKDQILAVGYYDDVSTKPTEQLLEQHLVIVEEEKSHVLLNDILATRATMAIPDSFFGAGEYLYYIKDKKSLKAIRLNDKS